MKAVVPEIAWHNKSPVFSIDIQLNCNKGFYRAATGGGDSHIVIWHLVLNESSNEISANFVADLDRHIKAVNVVRFSKNGELLASGDDDAVIIIWTLREVSGNGCTNSSSNDGNKENWVSLKTLRGHKDDIYDLCWSPFSNELLSGSVDNSAIVWDVDKGKNTGILGEHNGFVQGVAWDPKGKCLATLCSDRALRIFDADTKKFTTKITNAKLNKINGQESDAEDYIRLFHDDTVKTFFRRLCFSPDGLLIFSPCGIYKDNESKAKPPTDVSYIFVKAKPDRPILHLPSPDEYTTAIKCCPILFELNPLESNLFGLPYRILFAIASRRSIVFYDTQQITPFAFVTDIHYATLTDISWSHDGRLLIASSSDGYCTIVTFEEDELGVPYNGVKSPNTTLEDAIEDLGVQPLDQFTEQNIKTTPSSISINKNNNQDNQNKSECSVPSKINICTLNIRRKEKTANNDKTVENMKEVEVADEPKSELKVENSDPVSVENLSITNNPS